MIAVNGVPAPIDHPFSGTITLDLDATDVEHRIFRISERVPIQGPGPVTLLYPKWETASHGPSLSVVDLAGLEVRASGRLLRWRRDPVEPHAFRVEPPLGARELEVRFQMVAGDDLLTPDIVAAPWQRLILYPAGWYARNIPVTASVTLPAGLRPFTSLTVADGEAGGRTVRYAAVSMETLLDSPLLAGSHAASLPVTQAGLNAVWLHVVARRAEDLVVPADRLVELRRLVEQTRLVFGVAPYSRYDILARLSDDGSSGGSEHRASSELFLGSDHFRNRAGEILYRDLIAHEMIHAWNGLYRVPADLWAPTPNERVSGSLLWVYEGQTEFWARVLATRAGQMTPAEVRERLAMDAAEMSVRPGRAWRVLSDDVTYPSFMLRRPVPWRDWQRRRDYYSEGVLLWLDVDAELRMRSGGRRGMDDFARRFFAGAAPDAPTRTYDFDALCRALADTVAGDWTTYLRGWVDARDDLDTGRGLRRHGWRLAFSDMPTEAFRRAEEENGVADLTYSAGLTVTDAGVVRTVAWEGPAFRAGLRPGVRIVAVGDAPFSRARLLEAVRGASRRTPRITVEQDGKSGERALPYRGTLRYPLLERVKDVPDGLTGLLTAR